MVRARYIVAVFSIALLALTIPSGAPAFGPKGGTEVSTGTVPPNGDEVTSTSDVPGKATAGSITVQPLGSNDAQFFNDFTSVFVQDSPSLAKLSKRSQATLACVLISYFPLVNKPPNYVYSFEDVNFQVALLSVCLQMVLSVPAANAAPLSSAAAARCVQTNAALSVKITRSGARYRVTMIGRAGPVKRPSLTLTCRRSGKGLLLSVRPRNRRQTLRQAGAPKLVIGYANPTTKPARIRTTFTVH
jgi:hypothetical protein